MAQARIKTAIDLDGSKFSAGVRTATGSVNRFADNVGRIKSKLAGAFAIGGAVAFAKQITALGSALSDYAAQTGLTTDELQAFERQAIIGGAKLENVRNALVRLRTAQSDALTGNKRYQKSFEDVGISMDQLAGMTTGQLLEALAKAHQETGNFGVLIDTLGIRNAPKLEEALGALARSGFGGLQDEIRKTGTLIEADLIAKLDAAEDRIQLATRGVRSRVAVTFAEGLESIQAIGSYLYGFDQARGKTFSEMHQGGMTRAASTVQEQEAALAAAIERQDAILQRQLELNQRLLEQSRQTTDATKQVAENTRSDTPAEF